MMHKAKRFANVVISHNSDAREPITYSSCRFLLDVTSLAVRLRLRMWKLFSHDAGKLRRRLACKLACPAVVKSSSR